MKRYLLFLGVYYHGIPTAAGWDTFIGSFQGIEPVRKYLEDKDHHWDWYQIVDKDLETIIERHG